MELSFESKALRTVCENDAEAKLKLGDSIASALKHRLADLEAALSIKDLVVGHPSVVDGSEGEQMYLELCDGQRLIFAANHAKNPVSDNNELDWARVTRIRIVGIVSDHG